MRIAGFKGYSQLTLISIFSFHFLFSSPWPSCEVADLYGIKATLLDGGEIRGAGNAWICPELLLSYCGPDKKGVLQNEYAFILVKCQGWASSTIFSQWTSMLDILEWTLDVIGVTFRRLDGRPVLDEVEIRELLIDHVGHRCCWGSRLARTWKISAVEDCNVYVGTLDTFIEKREIIKETEPYLGGKIDGKDNGPELGVWELDLRSEFPNLFAPHKESQMKVPHSEMVEKCSSCAGQGEIPCPTCNTGEEPGFYKENQTFPCSTRHGRGLIAHRDGSDTICMNCKGKGKLPCGTCGSHGLVKYQTCEGRGALLMRMVVTVRWRTLSTRKVSATSGTASVPDEVFHRAKGIQLCNTLAYQCTPAFFADSYFLNKFSSEVIADRSPVPPAARVICERHAISVVPVTRVAMAQGNRSFSFYIIGVSREAYLKGHYPSEFCWGLCPCLDWFRL